jgi:hypothetical protein
MGRQTRMPECQSALAGDRDDETEMRDGWSERAAALTLLSEAATAAIQAITRCFSLRPPGYPTRSQTSLP